MAIVHYALSINPQQWAVGPLSVGRRNGKAFPIMGRNQELFAYQESIRELLGGFSPLDWEPGLIQLRFWFWRRIDSYEGKIRKVTGNVVDATNLQKALEDALQGVLFDNDRNVVNIHSEIVRQDAETEPGIVIELRTGSNVEPPPDFVRKLFDEMLASKPQGPSNNNNGPDEDWGV